MANRYVIWNKINPIITPSGKVYTAEQWMKRHPIARLQNVTVVCSAGEINGGFFGVLGQMVQTYTKLGADFSGAVTDEEKLDVIEAFEDAQNTPSTDERIAAALEMQAILAMDPITDDDPDDIPE